MAGGKGATFENSYLKLIFNATPIANVADNASSSPLTSLYLSLHTGTLTSASSQNTSEAGYGGYVRVGVVRTSSGFTVSGNAVTLTAAPVSFANAISGSETETYWGVGTASSGAGELLYWGPITPNIVVSAGVTPQLTTGTTITES